METNDTLNRAGIAAPEKGEGCEPASNAPFRTDFNQHNHCAERAKERKRLKARATTGKSTATQAQRERIIEMLLRGEQTTFDFRRAGIMQTSTRIFELRALGWKIMTVARRDLFDENGFRHERVAVYALPDLPEEPESSCPTQPSTPALGAAARADSVSTHAGEPGTEACAASTHADTQTMDQNGRRDSA